MTLEEVTQLFVDALSDERNGKWKQGEILLALMPLAQKNLGVLKELAKVAQVTVKRLERLREVAMAWPPDTRCADKPYAWHAALLAAWERGKTGASWNIWRDTHLDLTAAQARQLYQVEAVGWRGHCEECDLFVRVACRKAGASTLLGADLTCPYCTARTVLGRLARI